MAKVKSKNTKLELQFRKHLWRKGIRYRLGNGKYFGKPDLILKRKKIVIFIDSCFWHGCEKHLRMPKSNVSYWRNKITGNIKRDKDVNNYYKKSKWLAIRLWEHQLNTSLDGMLKRVKLC